MTIRLADTMPGDIVELAQRTLHGGTMHDRHLDAGHRLKVAWHSHDFIGGKKGPPISTFCHAWDPWEECYDPSPTSIAAHHHVVMIEQRPRTGAREHDETGTDALDPLRREDVIIA